YGAFCGAQTDASPRHYRPWLPLDIPRLGGGAYKLPEPCSRNGPGSHDRQRGRGRVPARRPVREAAATHGGLGKILFGPDGGLRGQGRGARRGAMSNRVLVPDLDRTVRERTRWAKAILGPNCDRVAVEKAVLSLIVRQVRIKRPEDFDYGIVLTIRNKNQKMAT